MRNLELERICVCDLLHVFENSFLLKLRCDQAIIGTLRTQYEIKLQLAWRNMYAHVPTLAISQDEAISSLSSKFSVFQHVPQLRT